LFKDTRNKKLRAVKTYHNATKNETTQIEKEIEFMRRLYDISSVISLKSVYLEQTTKSWHLV